MGKSMCRRAVIVVAGVAVLAGLSACIPPSTPTPAAPPTVQLVGISALSDDKSVGLRDLYVADPGPDGYQPGSSAPLAMQVWNNTNAPVSLVSAAASGVGAGGAGRPGIGRPGQHGAADLGDLRHRGGAGGQHSAQSGSRALPADRVRARPTSSRARRSR